MKIAIFGDIHGNLEALLACYSEALSRGAEKFYHLGDLGGYAPFINEVTDFLIKHDIAGVQGNYDDAVAYDREHCGCKYEDPIQAEMAAKSFIWTKQHASQATKNYLKNLPFKLAFSVYEKNILLFHASLTKNNLYWFEERSEKFFMQMAKKTNADVMIYGHTHKPYRKDIDNKIFINAGSVGKPKDGDIRACLTIIEITSQEIKTEFIRIQYDVEKTAAAIIENGLPEYFALKLKDGK